MKALVKTKPERGIELVDVAMPRLGADEVLIQVEEAGVCGSDVARYVWTRNYEKDGTKSMTDQLPRILGHEFAGTVVSNADSSPGSLPPGTRVAVNSVLGCGKCPACEDGNQNICIRRRTIGVHRDGGYAEYVAVPQRQCYPLPATMSFKLAAALQPYAVAVNAVNRVEVTAGARVVVWGLGTVGRAVCDVVLQSGGELVAAFDLNQGALDAAARAGLLALHGDTYATPEALEEKVERRSIDIFIDCAGALSSIVALLPMLRKGGVVGLVGNLPAPVEFDFMRIAMDQQSIVGSRSYSLRRWRQAIRLIGRGDFEAALGESVSLAESIGRFEERASGNGSAFSIRPTVSAAGYVEAKKGPKR